MTAAPATPGLIYHLCRREEWDAVREGGVYPGSSQDQDDGFIHFSTAAQVRESAAKHRTGQDGLVLLEVDAGVLGRNLKWEVSRGGQLFPHLYAAMPVAAVVATYDLPLDDKGVHGFPDHIPDRVDG